MQKLVFKITISAIITMWLACCLMVGATAASISFSGGPNAVLLSSLSATAIVMLLGGVVGFLAGETADSRNSHNLALVGCLVTAVCAAAIPITTLNNGAKEAASHRETAPLVQVFAETHFGAMDSNHDSVITAAEMIEAAKTLPLSSDEKKLLTYLQQERCLAGHVTDISSSVTSSVVLVGDAIFTLVGVSEQKICAVSREDLTGYLDRVKEKYRKW